MNLREYDETFIDMAVAASYKSAYRDKRRGTVIVKECMNGGEPHLLSIGFNHENDFAEHMAISQLPACLLKGATLYTTDEPSNTTERLIQKVGITTVVYKYAYRRFSLHPGYRDGVNYIHL